MYWVSDICCAYKAPLVWVANPPIPANTFVNNASVEGTGVEFGFTLVSPKSLLQPTASRETVIIVKNDVSFIASIFS